jgi:hypothetical protein
MKVWHPWHLKKIEILGAVLEQLAEEHCYPSPFTANMLVSSKTAPKDFDFFNGHGCQTFIFDEKH